MVQLNTRGHQSSCGTVQRSVPICKVYRSCVRSTAVRCFKGGSDDIGNKPSAALRLNFKIPYRVNFGQSLGLVGSGDSLGNWDPKRTVQMKWSDGDWWTVELAVAPGGALDLEYKYVVVNQDGNIGYWKPGNNYRITLPLATAGTKVPKRVKVADAWDESFKKVDIEETDVHGGVASAAKSSSTPDPQQQRRQQPQQPHTEVRQQVLQQPSPAAAATGAPAEVFTASTVPPVQPLTTPMPAAESNSSSNGTSPPAQAAVPSPAPDALQTAPQPVAETAKPPSAGVSPRAVSPRTAPPSFAAATTIPALHPSLLAEQEHLEDGVRNSLEDLQAQMDKHQLLRERSDDPAAVEILVADRIVAAANNRVVAYNKALKAVQEYNRLPTSASAPKESAPDLEK